MRFLGVGEQRLHLSVAWRLFPMSVLIEIVTSKMEIINSLREIHPYLEHIWFCV